MQSQTASYVITTLVTPPATSALTTLEAVKLKMRKSETADDPFFAAAIVQQSAVIARYCNRVFGRATWQDEFRPQRGIGGEGVRAAVNPLVLTRVPLVSVTSVVETIAGTATTLVAGTDYEIDAGSLLPGDEGASRLFRLNDNGNPRTWPAAQITVVYVAGYALPEDASPNLPPELQLAADRLVVMEYHGAGRDPMLRSEGEPGLGQRQYWVGPTPGQTGSLPPEVQSLVDRYRQPVVA